MLALLKEDWNQLEERPRFRQQDLNMLGYNANRDDFELVRVQYAFYDIVSLITFVLLYSPIFLLKKLIFYSGIL